MKEKKEKKKKREKEKEKAIQRDQKRAIICILHADVNKQWSFIINIVNVKSRPDSILYKSMFVCLLPGKQYPAIK